MSLDPLVLVLLLILAFAIGVLSSLLFGYRAAVKARQEALTADDMRIMVTILGRLVTASQNSQYGRLEFFDLCRAILKENIGAETIVIGDTDEHGELRIAESIRSQHEEMHALIVEISPETVVWLDRKGNGHSIKKDWKQEGFALMLEDGNRRLYLLQPLSGLSKARRDIFVLFLRALLTITNQSRQVARQQYASEKLSRELQLQILNLWRVVGGLHHNFRGIFSPGAFELQGLAQQQENGEAVPLEDYQHAVRKFGPSIPILMKLTESMGELQKHLRADHGPAMMEAQDLKDLFSIQFSGWLERQAELKQKKVKVIIEIPEDMQVLVERTAFFQIVWNVLYNALKYTREGSVHISAKEREDQRIYLQIEDTGAGIAAEDLEKIGQYQFRSSDTSNVPGHGVGLWFSKQLLESMGGELHISSKPGEGTLVEIGFQRAVLGRRRLQAMRVNPN